LNDDAAATWIVDGATDLAVSVAPPHPVWGSWTVR
jgi:hypothetical protein